MRLAALSLFRACLTHAAPPWRVVAIPGHDDPGVLQGPPGTGTIIGNPVSTVRGNNGLMRQRKGFEGGNDVRLSRMEAGQRMGNPFVHLFVFGSGAVAMSRRIVFPLKFGGPE